MVNIRTFDLNLLKIFDALMMEGTTVAAARRIGLSQPAVSAALARLRDGLQDDLFVRSGNRLVPTAHAEALAPQVAEMLTTAEALISGPERFDPARLERSFRISCGDYFAEVVLHTVVRRLQAEAPRVRIETYDEVFASSLALLRSDSFDLALLPEFEFPADIAYERLFISQFRIVCRPEHPRIARAGFGPGDHLPLDLFCDIPQVRYGKEINGNGQNKEDAALAAMGRTRQTVLTSPNFATIARMVQTTDLIGVLPAGYATRLEAEGALWGFDDAGLIGDLPIGIYWHQRHRSAQQHRWFRRLLTDEIKAAHAARDAQASDRPTPLHGRDKAAM